MDERGEQAKPVGCVLIVGPDGSGKTTVMDRLHAMADAAGVSVARVFWRPKIVPGGLSYKHPVNGTDAPSTSWGLGATVQLFLTLLDYLVAAAVPWRRARREGLLLMQRGWYDMVVDPRRYGLSPRLAGFGSALGRLAPRADVAVVLQGDPKTIRERKPELSQEEIARQLEAWRHLAPRAARRALHFDSATPDQIARVVWDTLPRAKHDD